MKEIIKKWLKFAHSDLEAAEILFINGEKRGSAYQICVYHCHQAIEKMLKSFIVAREEPILKIHDLVRLEELAQVALPDRLHTFIRDLNPHYQVIRYPDLPFVSKFIFSYKKEPTRQILGNTKELFIWLKKELTLK